jgi:hypothetical protein
MTGEVIGGYIHQAKKDGSRLAKLVTPAKASYSKTMR